jgi:hypothetical protein
LTIQAAVDVAVKEGWIEEPVVPALYVSAGGDTNPFILLHPDFLSGQAEAQIEAPNFFVYVDAERPGNGENAGLRFEDDRTTIQTEAELPSNLGDAEGSLLRVSIKSDRMTERQVAVLRLRMTNEEFAQAALKEGWSPEWFVGVCDGCGAFGGNTRCECDLEPEHSIPLRLNARYWVTDHLPRGDVRGTREGGEEDLVNGQLVRSRDETFPIGLRQVAFLSTGWRSRVADTIRLWGGPRVFESEPLVQDTPSDALGAPLGPSEEGT